jgi:hypothetical protein
MYKDMNMNAPTNITFDLAVAGLARVQKLLHLPLLTEEELGIVKHQVLGISNEDCARIFSCTVEDIEIIEKGEDFQKLKTALMSVHKNQVVSTDMGWDALESRALEKVARALDTSVDPDFHLRAATVANRAQRKMSTTNDFISTRKGDEIVHITIAQKLVQQLKTLQHPNDFNGRKSLGGTIVRAEPHQIEEAYFEHTQTEIKLQKTKRELVVDEEQLLAELAKMW